MPSGRQHQDISIGVSEYGCEGIITYHSSNPMCKDYTEEYQALYHEHMAKVLDERPYIWSSHVWNMFDFGCTARDEGGVAGRNNKGLVTMDRKTKKDSYYIYKAYWNSEPMVHLCGRRYAQRAGETTQIRVYSNQSPVSLYVNGKLVDVQAADKVFVFDGVALDDGMNIIVAEACGVKDSMTIEKVDTEPAIYVLPVVTALRLHISAMSSISPTAILPKHPIGIVTVMWVFWKSCGHITTAATRAMSVQTMDGISGVSSAVRAMDCMTVHWALCTCGAAGICWNGQKERWMADAAVYGSGFPADHRYGEMAVS